MLEKIIVFDKENVVGEYVVPINPTEIYRLKTELIEVFFKSKPDDKTVDYWTLYGSYEYQHRICVLDAVWRNIVDNTCVPLKREFAILNNFVRIICLDKKISENIKNHSVVIDVCSTDEEDTYFSGLDVLSFKIPEKAKISEEDQKRLISLLINPLKLKTWN